MSGRAVLLAVMFFTASPAAGQVSPRAETGNSHLQVVEYESSQVIQLRGVLGYQIMVELSPDEQVQTVALGDGSAWQVSVSKGGDRLFLKPSQPGASTNLTVVTSVRVYNFELEAFSGPSEDIPYAVRFNYPLSKPPAPDEYVDVSAASRRLSKYRISGDQNLRPSSVTDDGSRTFIVWPRSLALPAVYGLDRLGRESLLNGMMSNDDVYVVDGVPYRLLFRIDGRVARAERTNPRKDRGSR